VSDFLLELRSEEIPARMQAGARADLEKLLRKELSAAGVTLGEVTVWSTPRRLALIARDLPVATAAVSEELKGPRLGAPPQALEGFLRKTGLSEDQLTERDGVLFAVTEKPGRATAEVLAEAIPAIVRAFPWPKSQRWGAASRSTESLRWVRPLSGIVALLGDDLIACEVGGVTAGYATHGHRFHHSGDITIGNAADYQTKLRAAHVIVDHAERQDLIRAQSRAAAQAAGLTLVEDEGLVSENAGLTEWPVPLLGRFDADYLQVPPEVIQLTARTNQKYFVCQDASGKLANAFVCTANLAASDGGTAIIDGNRKVLAARLSDARFFWEQDRKKTLAEHAEGLARITFHEKLGTVADKAERVAKLARWLVEEGIVGSPAKAGASGDRALRPEVPAFAGTRAELADLAEQAARLCKADLTTAMVGEFPELQGVMGGYYARAEGLPDAVADAIRDHYKPVGQGDDVPTAPVTVAVSLADKLDTLFGFFDAGLLPTGSKDPFALRRAAIAYLRTVEANNVRVLVSEVAHFWNADQTIGPGLQVEDFLHDRLGVMMREEGTRYDFVQASTDMGTRFDGDLWRVRRRATALQSLIGTSDGTNLLAGYKRAANILKKEGFAGGEGIPLSYTPEPAEQALMDALSTAGPQAAAAVAAEDFAGAMAALASLRAPIDAFFDGVTVNDADPDKRTARLGLLAQFREAVHGVADFSKIEG
jgi:glycyl-tRNA synthetase beta chain